MYSITDPNLPELPSKLFHNLTVIQPLKGDDNQIPLFDDMEIKNKAISRSKSNENFNEEINTSSLNKFNNIILENEIPMNNEEPMKIVEKKYKLKSNSNDIIKIPENYSTDDEDEYKLVSILNEPLDDNWKLAIDDKKNNIKVYKKEVSYTQALLLKTFAEIPYSLKTIMDLLDDFDFRMKWDKTFQKIILVENLPQKENEEYTSFIQYSYMKFPAFMTDRDFLQINKTWKNYLGDNKTVLSHNKSTTHEKYPEKSNPIRAEMIIGGFYLKEINDNLTKIYLINNADVKVTTGISLVNKKAPESPQNFIICLKNGCDLWVKGKR
jgi:hypothetical protein